MKAATVTEATFIQGAIMSCLSEKGADHFKKMVLGMAGQETTVAEVKDGLFRPPVKKGRKDHRIPDSPGIQRPDLIGKSAVSH